MAPQGATDQLMLSSLLSWASVAPQGAIDLLMLSWLLSWVGWSHDQIESMEAPTLLMLVNA